VNICGQTPFVTATAPVNCETATRGWIPLLFRISGLPSHPKLRQKPSQLVSIGAFEAQTRITRAVLSG